MDSICNEYKISNIHVENVTWVISVLQEPSRGPKPESRETRAATLTE